MPCVKMNNNEKNRRKQVFLHIFLSQTALEKDETARKTGQDLGLIHSMKRDSILNNERQPQEIDIDKLTDRHIKMEEDIKEETEMKEPKIEVQDDGVVEMQGQLEFYFFFL